MMLHYSCKSCCICSCNSYNPFEKPPTRIRSVAGNFWLFFHKCICEGTHWYWMWRPCSHLLSNPSQRCSIRLRSGLCRTVKIIHTKLSHSGQYRLCFVHWCTVMMDQSSFHWRKEAKPSPWNTTPHHDAPSTRLYTWHNAVRWVLSS